MSVAVRLIRSFADLPQTYQGGAVAIGNFDGVHHGHARLVQRLKSRAAAADGPAVVFTFDPCLGVTSDSSLWEMCQSVAN